MYMYSKSIIGAYYRILTVYGEISANIKVKAEKKNLVCLVTKKLIYWSAI